MWPVKAVSWGDRRVLPFSHTKHNSDILRELLTGINNLSEESDGWQPLSSFNYKENKWNEIQMYIAVLNYVVLCLSTDIG